MKKEDFNGDITDSSLRVFLGDGKQIKVTICNCGECSNEFFIPASSDEYLPDYCPYCGIKFIKGESDKVKKGDK